MPAKKNNGPGLSSIIRDAGNQARNTANAVLVPDPVDTTALAIPGSPPVRMRRQGNRIFNVLEYIESSWGLGMRLYPVQRFLVKLYYFLPLDSVARNIEITDQFNSKVVYRFTEVEYLQFLFKEGRCNIESQDHERRELLLAIGRRGGKCIEGDSLVLTDRGIFRIEDLGKAEDESFSPTSIAVVQEAGRRATATAFYNGGVKSTFHVKTQSGYQLGGTGNHRVKVMGSSGRVEWRYLDEIKPGECVAINRTTDLWASEPLAVSSFHNEDGRKDIRLPEVLDVKWGNLLGYLVGDGTWGDDHAVSVTVEHPETWDHVTALFRELLGEPRKQMDERTANTGRLEVCSVRARKFLDTLGWKLGTARDAKMVPWAILRSPKPVVCAFLRGLFETDGCAESGGRKVTFSSASFRLAHEVQTLLLNLGIVSSVRRKWVVATQKHYANLTIRGVRSRRQFARLIGFDSAKKREPMLAALEIAEEGKSDTESLPLQGARIRDWLESIPKRNPARGELGWGRSKLREAIGNACKPGSGEDLTYPRLERALEVARELGAGESETAHFEELRRLDYFYDPVVSVEGSEDQVYDLTVPDGASFVANGMTNHNTTLSSIFASYEIYRLLNLDNPQDYYGLPNGDRIQIISVATDKDQAGILFNGVTTHLNRCEYFKPFIANNTLSYIQFRTPTDITRYGQTVRHENGKFVSFMGKATLRVTFKSCIAKGLRGSGNIVVILDEMAHFKDAGQSSAKDIYDAITPSTAAYSPKDPTTGMPVGPVESRVICISSPLNKTGKFYELYHLAMSRGEGSENMLAIQAPTWEVNPTIESAYYRQRYHADPTVFMTEHGAMFSDRVTGWIERETDLLACVDEGLRPKDIGMPRYPHAIGIDVGLSGDGTAVAITHAERRRFLEDGHIVDRDVVILDYHEYWVAGQDWRETNAHLDFKHCSGYARGLKEVERLDFDEIAMWLAALTKRFYITEGMFDRWNGFPLEQSLHKRGLTQFRCEMFKRELSSNIYQTAKLMMFDRRLSLYNTPVNTVTKKHSPLIQELLDLEAEQVSRNVVVVSKHATGGYADDVADALVRSIWLSAQRLSGGNRSTGPGAGGYAPAAPAPMTMNRYQAMRARRHGGAGEPRLRPNVRSAGLRRR